MDPKYPGITVTMKGKANKPMVIVNTVTKALHKAGLPDEAVDFKSEAMSGNHVELINTVSRWVTVK